MKERELVAAVLVALGRDRRCRVWRQNTGAMRDQFGRLVRFGTPGAADISGILSNGRRLEIECKGDGGTLRPEQAVYGKMIQEWGGVYVVARSVEDALKAVEEGVRW